jgi:hypothetical protein
MDPGKRKTKADQVQGASFSSSNTRLYTLPVLQRQEQKGLGTFPRQRRRYISYSATDGANRSKTETEYHLYGVSWLWHLSRL